MKNILFRGFDIEKNQWVEGLLAEHGIDTSVIKNEPMFQCEENHRVYTNSIGMFTGLFDKNGKKIYEGDIIKVNSTKYTVYYDEEKAAFACRSVACEIALYKVYLKDETEVCGMTYSIPDEQVIEVMGKRMKAIRDRESDNCRKCCLKDICTKEELAFCKDANGRQNRYFIKM